MMHIYYSVKCGRKQTQYTTQSIVLKIGEKFWSNHDVQFDCEVDLNGIGNRSPSNIGNRSPSNTAL